MGSLVWRNLYAKGNSQAQKYELIDTKVLCDLHNPGTNFRKKMYILALCVYIHPNMNSKNRPFQLSSTIGHIRICHTLVTNLKEVILQSSVNILTLKDKQSITVGSGAIS